MEQVTEMNRRGRLRNTRGQALAETGIVISFLLLLTIVIIEVARGFLVVNMITHAARDGARAAAVAEPRTNGTIQDVSKFRKIVLDEIRQVLPGDDSAGINVDVTQEQVQGVDMVQVRVSGSFKPIIWPDPFTVDRIITFRDEGIRGAPDP